MKGEAYLIGNFELCVYMEPCVYMSFDDTLQQIKKIIGLLKETGISEISLTQENGQTISVKNTPAPLAFANPTALNLTEINTGQEFQKINDTSSEVNSPSEHIIHSPMVGVFYSAPAPEALPFVEIGQTVKKGQILCIIEAMKMMNRIESDCDGIVKKCFVKNNQTVEFNQALFVIE